MPGFLPARLKTELFAHGLLPRKGGSARSKHALGRIRPPVASDQWSRLHSAPAARLAGAFRAVSPIGALPARSCSTDPDARVALPNLWRAVSARELIPTNEPRTLSDLTSEIDARIADDTRLLTTSPSLDMLYRLKLTWEKFGRCRPRLTDPPTRSRRSLGER